MNNVETLLALNESDCRRLRAITPSQMNWSVGSGAHASRFVHIKFVSTCIERKESWSAQNLISPSWPCSSLLESVAYFAFLKICFTFLKM